MFWMTPVVFFAFLLDHWWLFSLMEEMLKSQSVIFFVFGDHRNG